MDATISVFYISNVDVWLRTAAAMTGSSENAAKRRTVPWLGFIETLRALSFEVEG